MIYAIFIVCSSQSRVASVADRISKKPSALPVVASPVVVILPIPNFRRRCVAELARRGRRVIAFSRSGRFDVQELGLSLTDEEARCVSVVKVKSKFSQAHLPVHVHAMPASSVSDQP